MAATRNDHGTPFVIELEPELRRRVEVAAGGLGLSSADYVVTVIRRAVADDSMAGTGDEPAWSQLSSASFVRDWDSEEDRVYDGLS